MIAGPPDRHRSFCRLCQAACGVVVHVDGDRVVKVEGDPRDPVSHGYVCEKGRALGVLHHRPDRLQVPTLGREPVRRDATWTELVDDLGGRLAAVRERHGPDAVAVYNGTAGAYDAAGRLAQLALLRAMGSRSRYSPLTIDCPSKPLVAELVGGNMALNPVPDYDRSELLLYVGTNPVVSHGSLHGLCDPVRRIREVKQRGAVWVLDVRRTETARLATRHLTPKPGTDAAVLAHLVRELLADGVHRRHLADRTTGAATLADAVARFDRETTASVTGLPPSDLDLLVAAVRGAPAVSVSTGTGTSMSAAANVVEHLAWAIQIVTDSFERRGGSWFNPGALAPEASPSSGLPPSMGAERGPASRPELARRFGQLPCSALVDEIEAGNVRALLVFGGNPLTAFPEPDRLRRALVRLDVLAVWDVVPTPTTAVATHVLPALDSLERADINLMTGPVASRVIARHTPAVVPGAGGGRATWWGIAAVAQRMGIDIGIDPSTATDDDVLAAAFADARVGYDEVRRAGAAVCGEIDVPWVEDSVLPDGRWQLAPVELVDELRAWRAPDAGLVLSPQRERGHVNSTLATGRPVAEVHPDVAAVRDLRDGDLVRITTAAGSVEVQLRVHDRVGPGVVALPHGYEGRSGANRLISAVDVDPLNGMTVQAGLSVELEAVRPRTRED
ncbi:MAG: putative dehydrogenase [Actinomycetia bacterium]|nr:putative dehydrogenase [Actinomycetes bacterium]